VHPAGDSRGGGPVRSGADTEQRIQNWVRLVEEGAPREEVERAEKEVAQALRTRPFEIKQRLPFFQKMAKALRGRQAFQQFRLTGGRVVVDRRDKEADEGSRSAKEAPKGEKGGEAKGEHRLRDGKLVREKGRADIGRSFERGGLEQRVATDRVDKMLTAFERMVLSRFEDGKQIAQQQKDGKPVFAEKSEAQWKAFFKSFLQRTIKKSAKLTDIRNFLLRGLVPKGSKAVFIGDMHLKSGRVEKFIRFSILAEIIAKLRGKKPGSTIGKGELGELGEELLYLALAASRKQRFAMSKKAAEGKFMGGRAEARAAKDLGLSLESQLREKARHLKGRKGRGGAFGGLFGKDGEPEELPHRFVPWWRWGNLGRPGKFKWFTVFFYAALLALAIMGVVLMSMRLMSG